MPVSRGTYQKAYLSHIAPEIIDFRVTKPRAYASARDPVEYPSVDRLSWGRARAS
jgi:hypothetical protein